MKYLVWDELNASEDSAWEIEAEDTYEAAEKYAEQDSDGHMDGIYESGQPICVKTSEGRIHKVFVSVEYDPVYTARRQIPHTEEIFQKLEQFQVSSGVTHPAEAILDDYLDEMGDSILCRDFEKLLQINMSLACSFLMLLGRSNKVLPETRVLLVRRALASEHADIRDSAVTATESWGDKALMDLLREHLPKEPSEWLVKYITELLSERGDV